MKTFTLAVSSALVLSTTCCDAFTPAPSTIMLCQHGTTSSSTATFMSKQVEKNNNAAIITNRRSILSSIFSASVIGGASILVGPEKALAEAETMERGGVKLTPFNSLAFNYREGESPTVDSSALNEESITYSDFLDKLNNDKVKFVEFLAPSGDAAYVTFIDGSKPIRIGEGYPIEDPGGWSSPAFVVKAVAKKGVPYKFVVPGLGDSFVKQ